MSVLTLPQHSRVYACVHVFVCVCVCVEHMVFFPQTGCLLLMAVATTAIKSDGNFNKIQRAGVRLSVER